MSLKKVTGHKKFEEHKCASKGCNKKGRHHLRVLYLNKDGYFCDSCKISLLEGNLVEEPKVDVYG
jgi:hypothetical protein